MTCWVPFMDTDVHNGGMGVMEGSHRLAKVGSHFGCEGDTWYVSLDKDAMERELQCSERQDERQCKVAALIELKQLDRTLFHIDVVRSHWAPSYYSAT